MATQKPISTISYNTKSFLLEKLNTWYNQHIIQAYQVIFHKGEDGDKDHAHVRIEPNKKLDPMELTELLKEYVKDNDKPLGVRPWRPSKEEDWYLYVVHDKDYLQYHGEDKGEKMPYSYTDIFVSPYYDLDTAFIRAKSKMKHSTINVMTRLKSGEDGYKLVLDGVNPFMVNAMVNVIGKEDYPRLLKAHEDLQKELSLISQAIADKGLAIASVNGKYVLVDNVFNDNKE